MLHVGNPIVNNSYILGRTAAVMFALLHIYIHVLQSNSLNLLHRWKANEGCLQKVSKQCRRKRGVVFDVRESQMLLQCSSLLMLSESTILTSL